MTTTPVVRTPIGAQASHSDWLGRYHELAISVSGRKTTPRRALFADERRARIDSPLVLGSSGELSDADMPRWSVESACSELKSTPVDYRSRGFGTRILGGTREGVMGMRYSGTGSRSGDRGPSICIMPTPDLWPLPASTLPRKKQRVNSSSVKR